MNYVSLGKWIEEPVFGRKGRSFAILDILFLIRKASEDIIGALCQKIDGNSVDGYNRLCYMVVTLWGINGGIRPRLTAANY